MDVTLAILAAGIGSRYGAGIKQLEHVGPSGEIIMDYSIHDAVMAGFNKVVFIIRRDIYDDFLEVIGNRLEAKFRTLGVKWAYAFQEMTDMPAGRTKPWGTGHAILCSRQFLDGPFAVINADDYYGKHAFEQAHAFLTAGSPAEPGRFGMIGFKLMNTLSDAGGVTRGVCQVGPDGYVTDIVETRHIVRTPEGAAVQEEGGLRPLDRDSIVSMNMWLFTPQFTDCLEEGFRTFRAHMADPLQDEYLLPEIVGRRVGSGMATVKVLLSGDQWFGITYHEDRQSVTEAFHRLVAQGVYPPDLYSDI